MLSTIGSSRHPAASTDVADIGSIETIDTVCDIEPEVPEQAATAFTPSNQTRILVECIENLAANIKQLNESKKHSFLH